MKRIFTFLAALMIGISLTACSSQPKPEDTVNAFWTALESGNIETASKYTSSEAAEYLDNLTTSGSNSLMEALSSYTITDELQAKIDLFTSNIVALTFQSHQIVSSEKISDDEYDVNVTVSTADSSGFNKAIAALDYDSELDAHQDEILQVMSEEGVEKGYLTVFGIIFDFINSNMDMVKSNLEWNDQQVTMKLLKTDDGSWTITEIKNTEVTE